MAFPLTHMLVAEKVLEKLILPSPEQFILGSIAPDAVHYRKSVKNDPRGELGSLKKITHLCPTSEERWGYITDNDGWGVCVEKFLEKHPNDSLYTGYAMHVLTDMLNNKLLWYNFRTKHPEEAAKGYTSDYYKDLSCIDFKLYNDFANGGNILTLLEKAEPQDIPGLVTSHELGAIQNNLLHVQYANAFKDVDTTSCTYVTYEQILKFSNLAANYCANILSELTRLKE